MGKIRARSSSARRRFGWVDPFLLLLLTTLAVAALWPPLGWMGPVLSTAAGIAVGLQFFISGLRLPPAAALQGVKAWRPHLVIVAFSFAAFPLLGLGVAVGSSWLLSRELVAGLVFLTMLPTAVQSATTFTGIAGGNTALAVCAASISNLLGVVATPLLAALVLGSFGSPHADAVLKIALQIFAPFVAGQLLHRPLARWTVRRAKPLRVVDRSAILLVVYGAFGAAVAGGLWQQIPPAQLAVTAGICAVLLALVLSATSLTARRLGFGRADATAVLFCGSQKSLASGLPLSAILFQGSFAGVVILPVIMYHAMQLIVCAAIARRLAKRAEQADARAPLDAFT
ncbi:bile acid:sodium symporter [Arthrobacter sp. NtRootA9]|nr:bile acid:sodium symporter [Arthrobacter sp. NtRootA9]